MTRKIIATITAALLALALLPGVAMAAATGTARLTSGVDIHPGPAQDFAIQVANNELRLIGRNVNLVRVILPNNAGVGLASDGYTAPDGWEVFPTSAGFLQQITYRATGSGLAPGSNVTFPFPAEVLRPSNGDRTGDFGVFLSSNGGDSFHTATPPANGTLTTNVRVLEILPDTLGALSPPGATDGSGSAGQTITYGFQVYNHATQALTVQADITSNNVTDQITAGPAVSVGPASSETLTAEITLGGANQDRTSTFRSRATATDANPSAQTPLVEQVYAVQVPPTLELLWDTFRPRAVRSNAPVSYTFEVDARKTRTPTWTLEAGTLEFCDNTAALQTPVTFGPGTQTDTIAFGPIQIDFDGDYTDCDAVFNFSGPDGNDFVVEHVLSRANLISIDNLIPVIDIDLTLPRDAEGRRQTAAKNGDNLAISGSVSKGCNLLDHIQLLSPSGDLIAEAPGSAVSCNGNNFSHTFQNVAFGGASEFYALAQATDAAGNTGFGVTEDDEGDRLDFIVDNVAPAFTYAQTLVLQGSQWGSYEGRRGVLVRFTEQQTYLVGGCSRTQWRVQGQLIVENVLNSDGSTCSGTQPGPDNDRIIIVPREFERDARFDVTYTPTSTVGPLTVRAKDGAANYAVQNTIEAVVGIVPGVPEILEVLRNNGEERATFDEERYWTRFGGSDLEVRFAGGRDGYTVEVHAAQIDANGECFPMGAPLRQEPTTDGTNTTIAPIGNDEGDYVRSIRLRNVAGVGPALCFTVALDQTAPEIVAAATTVPDQVDVSLSEPVLGPQAARHWYAWEDVEARDDHAIAGRDYYQAESVAGQRDERRLTVKLGNNGPLGGVDYLVDSWESDDSRLVDRAGNALANTIAFD